MRRRLFLKFCVFCATASSKSAHAWPVGKCGEEQPRFTDYAGCMVMGTRAANPLRHIKYQTTLDDDFLWSGFIHTQIQMELMFEVKPSFLFFSDVEAPNAFAFDVGIDAQCTPDGTVAFGTTLIATEREADPVFWGSALSVIVAHEYGHISQYKRALDMETFRKELHADFLAGWAIATMNRNGVGSGVNPSAAAATLFARGDYNFNEPNFHGTPEQRSELMAAGYECGLDGRDLQSAFIIGTKLVSQI